MEAENFLDKLVKLVDTERDLSARINYKVEKGSRSSGSFPKTRHKFPARKHGKNRTRFNGGAGPKVSR